MNGEVVFWIAVAVACTAALIRYVPYYVGLAFSRGYHKGKKEFVDQVINENTDKENLDG